MASAPALIVEGIARQPLPFGLLSVLTPRAGADAHWQNGVEWETLGCAPASGIGDPQCDPDEETIGLPKNLNNGAGDFGGATPFTIYGSYTCTPVGHTVEYAQERATEHLLAREEARAEQALWTGDLGNGGFAADAENAGSGGLARAVARLEQWLGVHYGSQGVLHMTRESALLGISEDVLTVRGTTLVTELGTPVIAGAGYPGTGPAGQDPAADQTYIYATPALVGYRSEVFPSVSPASAGFDQTNNNLHAVAERTYVIGYDPCGTAYVLADLPE